MLIALTEEKNAIVADNANKGKPYFCQHCDAAVHVKKGPVKIAHFAHFSKNNCSYPGESEVHLEMKKFF